MGTCTRAEIEDAIREKGVLNLSGQDLQGLDLAGLMLGKANLSKANLEGTDLCDADLAEADLDWANLSQANLERANLRGAHLFEANLEAAKLSGADLSGADLESASLYCADLSGANLSGADLSAANLAEADLHGADLSWAFLDFAKLIEADLRGATLIGANTLNAEFTGAKHDDQTKWSLPETSTPALDTLSKDSIETDSTAGVGMTEQTEKQVGICKRCKAENRLDAVICWRCHGSFEPEPVQARSPQKAEAAADMKESKPGGDRKCSFCGEFVPSETVVCPWCGRRQNVSPMSDQVRQDSGKA